MPATHKALIIAAALIAIAFGFLFGGAVPTASAQTISVTSANPPSGEQGTLSLDVVVGGKGFKNGAKAKFYKAGTTDPAGVAVKSTRYVSSSQVVATIDIADTAALAAFDIQVSNADGRTGKGTELFSVVAKKIDPCTIPDPTPTLNPYTSGPPGLPGYLDSTFGGSGTGKVIGVRGMNVEGMAIQKIAGEARIVAVGSTHDNCQANPNTTWTIVRYRADGSLDGAFGTGGVVTTVFPDVAIALAVVTQPDSKIVVAGRAEPKRGAGAIPTVVRYNPDGGLDASFGSAGVVMLSFGKFFQGGFEAAAMQSDGKIIAVGYGSQGLIVVRLTAAGRLDTSFNGSGENHYSAHGHFRAVTTQWVSGQEYIVVAGYVTDEAHGNYLSGWLVRFTNGGTLDTSFGSTGGVITDFCGFEDAYEGMAIDSLNRIVAIGETWTGPYDSPGAVSGLALVRYDQNGNLDPSFGTGGKVAMPPRLAREVGYEVAIDSYGRILAAGYGYDTPNEKDQALVWRFADDGTPDALFADFGRVADPIIDGSAPGLFIHAMTLQPDGKVVLGGRVGKEQGTFFAALARVWQ